jgi:hypothetical protein
MGKDDARRSTRATGRTWHGDDRRSGTAPTTSAAVSDSPLPAPAPPCCAPLPALGNVPSTASTLLSRSPAMDHLIDWFTHQGIRYSDSVRLVCAPVSLSVSVRAVKPIPINTVGQ